MNKINKVGNQFLKCLEAGQGYNLVVEHLPSMCKALNLIPPHTHSTEALRAFNAESVS
jgi:hypothetical protein